MASISASATSSAAETVRVVTNSEARRPLLERQVLSGERPRVSPGSSMPWVISSSTRSRSSSEPHLKHKIYPYLPHLGIERPNQVWCADVNYIPMRRGFSYLVAIMDWASRKVLAWRLSNSMGANFCVAALEEAIARHGSPTSSTAPAKAGARAPSSPASPSRTR
jgi:transposase InsO family protein